MVLLWKGADWFVDAAARTARRFNVSELVIGLTVVAFATSAPEFVVSIGAALRGHSDISVGNIVGSNVFNLGFILGGCAIIRPIKTGRTLVYRDMIILILVTLVLSLFIGDLTLSRLEGGAMIGALATYIIVLFWRKSPVEESQDGDDAGEKTYSFAADAGFLLLGLAMIIGGAELLVLGASAIARSFGWSEWAIGFTIVAAGTSAPELVTTLNASFKGKYGISAGGLVGSDLYNILGVLGVAAIINPLAVNPVAISSVLILFGMVVVVFIFMRTGWQVSRREGILLVAFNAIRFWAEITGPGTPGAP